MNFQFGATKPATTTATTGFNFGGGGDGSKVPQFGSLAQSPQSGLTFGGAPTQTASAPALNFGLGSNLSTNTPATSAQPAFNLSGQTGQPAATGLTFGNTAAPAANTSTPPTGFNFGNSTPASTSIVATSTSIPNFGLSGATSTAPTAAFGGLSAATTTAAPKTNAPPTLGGFNFGTPSTASTLTPANTTATSTTFSLGATSSITTPASTGFSLSTTGGVTSTTTGTPLTFVTGQATALSTSKPSTGLSFGTTPVVTSTTTASTGGFSLTGSNITTSGTITPALTTTTTTPATTTATTTSTATVSSQNFADLEESINKWTLELEEQEKVFMNQAVQLNAWDQLLIKNGDKLIELNSEVERVKQDQQQLDHELDFIVAQQRELEDLVFHLEKELENVPNTDPDRQHIYQLAENMDSQLKQMSEDLKEIIEHLNESNRAEDPNDPIVQIGRILNAHMNSLQWIDRNTALIGNHLNQVTKLYETHRREHERSFHLTYE